MCRDVMIRRRCLCAAGLLSYLFMVSAAVAQPAPFAGATPARAGDGLAALHDAGRHLSEVTARVTPAVVHIECRRETYTDLVEETGSGVLMRSPKTSSVFVVTNRHVVLGCPLSQVNIHLADGRVIHPVRMLEDMATDLAVLLLEEPNLATASWGDSDNLDIGSFVLAVGSPFGLSRSVTLGIISAKGRRSLSLGGPREVINQDFLQTDAAINPGNSGGPLIDLHGHVVGINTAIASQGGGNEGIGFSIPINLVRYVVDQLLEHGRVHRGYLGVRLDDNFTLATARRFRLDRLRGARVVQVYPDTPASAAGLRVDDVILTFDGIQVEDESHLIHRVSLTPLNKTVRVVVLREGKELALQVTLMERPVDNRAERPPVQQRSRVFPGSWKEISQSQSVTTPAAPSLLPLDENLRAQLGITTNLHGLLVCHADATTALMLYDVISRVGAHSVSCTEELQNALAHETAGKLLVEVSRQSGQTRSTRLLLCDRHELLSLLGE